MSRTEVKAAMDSGRPFLIHTIKGEEFVVPHRDYVALSGDDGFIVVMDNDEGYHFLSIADIDNLTVSEPHQQSA